jgi:hypothetical protein
MDNQDAIRALMSQLMKAVESSLTSSRAVRDALAELTRNGYEARLFFVANAESAADDGDAGADGELEAEIESEVVLPGDGEAFGEAEPEPPEYELTKLDQAFLKSLNIRPEPG